MSSKVLISIFVRRKKLQGCLAQTADVVAMVTKVNYNLLKEVMFHVRPKMIYQGIEVASKLTRVSPKMNS